MGADDDDSGATELVTSPYQPANLLPVSRHRDGILYTVEKHTVTVVVGQTGSGKSTQIPQYLYNAGWCDNGKQIAITQPRRVAVISVATRVAEEMGSPLGETVGYSIRFDDQTSDRTSIRFLTDGLLLREALVDPLFTRYSVIMIDEAHERTLSSDVLLGLLKKVVRKRPELRIIISSATIQAESIVKFFTPDPDTTDKESSTVTVFAMKIEGRAFPVETHFLAQPTEDYVDRAVQTVMDIHTTAPAGDILVFLTGRDEIERAMELISDRLLDLSPALKSSLIVVPLYASLSPGQQMSVFDAAPEGCRKVVVATNIAEASVTINGIVYVVDCGFVKLRSFNPLTGFGSLTTVPISQASAIQRAGRAGRTQAGKSYALYTQTTYTTDLSATTVPEIQRSNLTGLILQLKALGIDNVSRFPFLTPPPPELFTHALELLFALGAVDEYAKLTRPIGLQMAELAIDPMLAKSLLSAGRLGCLSEMLSVVAVATVNAPIWHDDGPAASRRRFAVDEGDHLTMLNAFNAFYTTRSADKQTWCRSRQVSFRTLTQAANVRRQLAAFLDRFGVREEVQGGLNGTEVYDAPEAVRRCLTAGLFPHAAQMQPDGSFATVSGTIVHLHPSSVLFNRKAEWVIFADLTATNSGKLFIKDVTKIERDWLVEYGGGYYQTRNIR